MNFKILKNKKILITGHTGFKGSWLTMILSSFGANVVGISKYKLERPSLYSIIKLNTLLEKEYIFDLADFNKTKSAIIKEKPDFIFHLAAQPIVSTSLDDPILNWNSNLMGSLSVLESIKKLQKKISVVMITSDKCYHNNEWIWGYKENDKLGGDDPYSASKAATEIMINSHIKSFFSSNSNNKFISSARAGNVIGGGDWAKNRIVPDCIRSIIKNNKINIRNPNSTRPWQHVLEPLFGYIILGISLYKNKNLHGESFNFGPDVKNDFPVIDLVKNIIGNFDEKKIEYEFKSKKVFKESGLLKLNCEKAIKLLNWKPILTFDETTDMTSKWYKNYLNNQNMYNFTNDQINKYINKLKS